jgi:hypothetical protein
LRLALPEQAGADEPRDGQHENQRYWCDLSRPHGETSGDPTDSAPSHRQRHGAVDGWTPSPASSPPDAGRDVLAVPEGRIDR